MRIAVLSDIHGNIAALDAVLADVAERRVDRIVNLGDICSGPLFPSETADRLIPLGLPTIRGNHERQLLAPDLARMGPSDRHAAETLRPDQRDWIEALPASLTLPGGVLLVHATPANDLDYFLETVTPHGLRAATRDEVADRAGDADVDLILCGHTHVPRLVRLDDGRLIVNPGSVGLPGFTDDRPFRHCVQAGSPHARYAIVERGDDGWSADFRTIAYDWGGAADRAADMGAHEWAAALRTGWLE